MTSHVTILQQSPPFLTHRKGTAPYAMFFVNGREYKRGYYLTDEIYPTWSTFVKVYPCLILTKKKRFSKLQVSARKDVGRAFGVLKAIWGVLRQLMWAVIVDNIRWETYTCVIWHKMIIIDDGNAIHRST
ncbi:uncharacterized protein LOC143609943 [Bidens hawaiensis]|uniref:uncharacterized protein LOC143609943 n=1 Tax=Bidens hawaiensis TaxID=980011 RepID=UPI00404A14EC